MERTNPNLLMQLTFLKNRKQNARKKSTPYFHLVWASDNKNCLEKADAAVFDRSFAIT